MKIGLHEIIEQHHFLFIIFKCNKCGAVYHNACMSYEKACPRCERWKKHEAVMSLDENENSNGVSTETQ